MVVRMKDVIRRIDKELYDHMDKIGIDFLQFSFRWMNCLLLRELKKKFKFLQIYFKFEISDLRHWKFQNDSFFHAKIQVLFLHQKFLFCNY